MLVRFIIYSVIFDVSSQLIVDRLHDTYLFGTEILGHVNFTKINVTLAKCHACTLKICILYMCLFTRNNLGVIEIIWKFDISLRDFYSICKSVAVISDQDTSRIKLDNILVLTLLKSVSHYSVSEILLSYNFGGIEFIFSFCIYPFLLFLFCYSVT